VVSRTLACWIASLAAAALAALAVLAVAGHRLLSTTGAPDTHWLVSLRLLLGLLPTALEVGFLLAVPLGLAIGLRRGVGQRGPSEHPVTMTEALGLGFGWLVVSLLFSGVSHAKFSEATSLIRGLLTEAREACEHTQGRRSPVPILGADWRCEIGKPARLLGSLRGRGVDGSYALGALELGERPPSLLARELSVTLTPQSSRPGLKLVTRTAKVIGVFGLPPPSRLSPWWRGGLVASTTAAVVLLGCLLGRRRWGGALLLGLTPAGLALTALLVLDRAPGLPLLLYFALPLPALLVMLLEFSRSRRGTAG